MIINNLKQTLGGGKNPDTGGNILQQTNTSVLYRSICMKKPIWFTSTCTSQSNHKGKTFFTKQAQTFLCIAICV